MVTHESTLGSLSHPEIPVFMQVVAVRILSVAGLARLKVSPPCENTLPSIDGGESFLSLF